MNRQILIFAPGKLVNLAHGYKVYCAEISSNIQDLAKLKNLQSLARATANLVADAMQVESISEVKKFNPVADIQKLKLYLQHNSRKKPYSIKYIKNAVSMLRNFIKYAEVIPDTNPHADWFLEKYNVFGIKLPKKIEQKYFALFLDFLKANKIEDPMKNNGDFIVKEFANYLVNNRILSFSTRQPKTFIKNILIKLDFKFAEPAQKIRLSATLEANIQAIKVAALTGNSGSQIENNNLPLSERIAKRKNNPSQRKPIKEITWKRHERTLLHYLQFVRSKNLKLKSKQLADHFTIKYIYQFFDEKYRLNSFTKVTVETYITALSSCISTAFGAKIGGFGKETIEEFDEFKEELWDLTKAYANEFKKKGIKEQRLEEEELPDYKHIVITFIVNLQKELLEISKQGLTENNKLKIRNLCILVFILSFSPRPNDIFNTIKVSNVKEICGQYFIKYLPSKTVHRNKSEVNATILKWFAPLIDFYLKNVRTKIHPNSDLMFPASLLDKRTNIYANPDDDTIQNNKYEWQKTKTLRYFGQHIGENIMRTVLATFCQINEFSSIERYLGHSAQVNKITAQHYLVYKPNDCVHKDLRNMAEMERIFEIDGDEIVKKIKNSLAKI